MLVLFIRTKGLHRLNLSFHLEPDRTFRRAIPVTETSFHNKDRSSA
jgi:hypothetical protein